MIRSMTGFGEGVRTTANGSLRVEVRSVNHRHLLATVRLPEPLHAAEGAVRDAIRARFSRGHVTCSVRLDALATADGRRSSVRADLDRARDYLAAFGELGSALGIEGKPDLALLARFADVLVRDAPAPVDPPSPEQLLDALEEALAQATGFREQEGARLAADLRDRLRGIESVAARIETRAPERLAAERDRLRGAVRELAEGLAVDEARLAQEIAWLAEKWDINEEIVRLRSHLTLFGELLSAPAEEPVGKRLGFVVQEMGREINTMGSKANDATIAHEVIAAKDDLERLREQVENIE